MNAAGHLILMMIMMEVQAVVEFTQLEQAGSHTMNDRTSLVLRRAEASAASLAAVPNLQQAVP